MLIDEWITLQTLDYKLSQTHADYKLLRIAVKLKFSNSLK